MKNRILFISLAVVLALSVGLIGCEKEVPEGPDKVVIGLARDMDEALSFFECGAGGSSYRWFIEKVNAEGGVHLSEYDTASIEWYVDIEPLVRDFSLEAFDIAAVTEGLIDDGADFIFGGPGTATINPQADVCNAYGVLHFTLEGGASDMIWDGDIDDWPYTWVSLTFANWNEMPVLSEIIKANVVNPKAYVTYIQDQHGYEYLRAFSDEFGDENIYPAGTYPDCGVGHAYGIDSAAANLIIQNAAAALVSTPYDIFCAFTYPWNVAELVLACALNEFNPPAIIMGPGANFANFGAPPPDGFGGWMEGIMCFAVANEKTEVKVGTPTMTMAAMYEAIAAQLEKDWADPTLPCDPGGLTDGMQANDWWGYPCYAASLEMFKYAVEDAGTLDAAKVRDALVSYDADNPAETVFGDTWYTVFGNGYGGGILAKECKTGEIGQWINGYVEIVGYAGINSVLPNYDATADFVYPMTDKWTWLAG